MNSDLKQRIYEEFVRYWIYTAFLTLFFLAFSIYRELIVGENPVDYFRFGYDLFQSMILAKIILIGQTFHLGEKYSNRPLIIPTVYKTLVFTFFVLTFMILESFVMGFVHGKNMHLIFQKLIDSDINEILAKILIMLFFFAFFFAFLELDRYLGGSKLLNLFFNKKSANDKENGGPSEKIS